MKDKSKITAIILIIITLIIVIISVIFNNDSEKENIENIEIVKNYSNFYTVNSCLYRLTTYLSMRDVESLLFLLNDEYEKDNNINSSNVFEFFPNVESDSTFISEKMYSAILNENLTKYYVKGYIQKNQIFDDTEANEVEQKSIYFIVYLDTMNKIFSVEPYDGKVFIEGDINEK